MPAMLRRTGRTQVSRRALRLLGAVVLTWGAIGATSGEASAARFAVEPIAIQRINLPASVKDAMWPAFTTDGRHLVFFSANELWITSLRHGGAHCLSCGLAHDPKVAGIPNLVSPFPDGKRLLFGGDGEPGPTGVLECAPRVVECRHRQILRVDFSNADPSPAMGGVVTTPQVNYGGPYQARLSPDGRYIGFSEIRSDSIAVMVVARLVRARHKYVLRNPRVINPPAPKSVFDRNIDAWSEGSALVEFKGFSHGGADATYVSVGGPALLNPDVWSVNLATGVRTRLTGAPDWEEDSGVSPNGRLMSVWSFRTMHYVDWFSGLLPVRDFLDAPAAAMAASTLNGAACAGPMWLLPSSGDRGGALAGEPIVDYRYPHVHVTDNLSAGSQWSPDGTMIALSTTDDATGKAARFLLVAHLKALKATKPLAPVSSAPGSWAPPPSGYHGAMGFDGTVTLHGPGGGTVTLDDGGTPGALAGQWTETYHRYSDNGRDFVTGTVGISGSAVAGTVEVHLTMTGADKGSDSTDLDFGPNGTSGSARSKYDGHTITGPPPGETGPEYKGGPSSACPSRYPKKPALHFTAARISHRRYRLKVTASVPGVGANEAAIDNEPVRHAAIRLGRAIAYTNRNGIAIVTVARHHKVRISAGDTLQPTSGHL
jgi:hypothetical protein